MICQSIQTVQKSFVAVVVVVVRSPKLFKILLELSRPPERGLGVCVAQGELWLGVCVAQGETLVGSVYCTGGTLVGSVCCTGGTRVGSVCCTGRTGCQKRFQPTSPSGMTPPPCSGHSCRGCADLTLNRAHTMCNCSDQARSCNPALAVVLL